MRTGQRLSRNEIELVLHRAAELDRVEDGPDELDIVAVQAAATEAGLSPASVCQALAELRAGTLRRSEGPERRLLGPPSLVVRRLVPGPREMVRDSLHRFLCAQLFELQRDFGEVTSWVRREGLLPALRRRLDVNHRLALNGVRHLRAALDSGHGDDGRHVMVSLVADVGEQRQAHAWLLASGATAGAAVVGLTAAVAGLDPVTLLSLPAGAGLALGGHRWGLAQYRRQVASIEAFLAGFLDRLERRPSLAPGPSLP